jgi:hypothetical protein
MEGTRAARAPRFTKRRRCRLARVGAFVMAGLWGLTSAGSECVAGNAADGGRAAIAADSETTTDLKPRAPLLNEPRHSDAPLLAARLGNLTAPRSAPVDEQALRARLPVGRPISMANTIDGDSLHLPLPREDFEDTGPGTLKLSMSGLDVDADRSVAGGRAQLVTADNERGRWALESRLAWLFEYLQSDATAAAFFKPGDKGIFAVQGLGYGSNWAILGSGLRWQLIEGWSGYAGYDAQFNSQQLFHIGSAGVDYAW